MDVETVTQQHTRKRRRGFLKLPLTHQPSIIMLGERIDSTGDSALTGYEVRMGTY